MNFVIGLLVGLFFGTGFGFTLLALAMIASQSRDRADLNEEQMEWLNKHRKYQEDLEDDGK